MTDAARVSPAAAKRRQALLLGGITALIVGAAVLSVVLTGSQDQRARDSRPQTTHILAPGNQVDPRDAWRGQADAQLKTIEQKSREMHQRNAELETQNKAMLERLKKLEETRLTALPPPPTAAPAARPNFGPDPANSNTAQRLPPPPPPRPVSSSTPPSSGVVPAAMSPSGIVSIVLGEGPPAKTTRSEPDA